MCGSGLRLFGCRILRFVKGAGVDLQALCFVLPAYTVGPLAITPFEFVAQNDGVYAAHPLQKPQRMRHPKKISKTKSTATATTVVVSSRFAMRQDGSAQRLRHPPGLGAGVEISPQTKVVTGTIGVGLGGWGGSGGLNIASGFIPICP
jgi:hypothetical protein